MPFGDPRPLRRRRQPLTSKVGPGQKATTESRRPEQLSTALKVGLMLADLLEMSRMWKDLYPMRVRTGARINCHKVVLEDHLHAVLDVDHEDGRQYQILVVEKGRSSSSS